MKRFLVTILIVVILPAFAYASGNGEAHEGGMGNFWWRILNFVILAVVLYKLSAKAIVNFFVGNRASIKNSLDEAVRAKEEAEKKLVEHSARLDKATAKGTKGEWATSGGEFSISPSWPLFSISCQPRRS